jgi:hypothetical protein
LSKSSVEAIEAGKKKLYKATLIKNLTVRMGPFMDHIINVKFNVKFVSDA